MGEDEGRVPFPWKRGLTIALPWTLLGLVAYLIGVLGAGFALAAEGLRIVAYKFAWWADRGLGFNPMTREEWKRQEDEEYIMELLQELRRVAMEKKDNKDGE